MPKKAVTRQRKAPISRAAGFPYRLDVLVMKEGEWLVAQCLQYDLTAQAKTFSDLEYAFEHALIGHVVTSVENNLSPFESLPPAPKAYWEAWRRALRLERPAFPAFRVPRSVPIPPGFMRRKLEFRVGDLSIEAKNS